MIYSLYFSLAAGEPLETTLAHLTLKLEPGPDERFYPYRGEAPEANARYWISEVYGLNDIFLLPTDFDYEVEIRVLSDEVEQASGAARALAQRLFATLKALQKYH